MNEQIIAVDFDGTLCENKWPEIGEPNTELIGYLIVMQKTVGAKVILWTCRVGEMLDKAVNWCSEHGLEFDAVNENLPHIIERFGSDTRKIFANMYIDDRNFWYDDKSLTIEKVLSDLGKRHFEIYWRYEVLTNSIIIQLEKRVHHRWYRTVQKVRSDDICHSNGFDFFMVQILKNLAQELEQDIAKGENKDAENQ